MSFLSKLGLKTKQAVTIDDHFYLRFKFSADFDPDKNEAIAQLITKFSERELEAGSPPLNETLPDATLKNGEDLFQAIRDDYCAPQQKKVSFASIEIMEFDANEKRSKKNPATYIQLENFAIDYDYLNLTKSFIETIFNSQEYLEVDYQDKSNFASVFLIEYQDALGIESSHLAKIPTEDEAAAADVVAVIPALSVSEQPIKKKVVVEPRLDSSSQERETQMNGVRSTKDSQSSGKTVQSQSKPVPALNRNSQLSTAPTAQEVTKKSRPNIGTRANQTKPRDFNGTEMGLPPVEAEIALQRFDVKLIDPVPPEHKNYVEYRVNEKKKQFNVYLKNVEDTLNARTEQDLLKRHKSGIDEIQAKVKSFIADNDAAKGLKEEVVQRIDAARKAALAQQSDTINQTADQDIEKAKRVYDQQVEDINNDRQLQLANADQQLRTEYAEKANDDYQTTYQQRLKVLEPQIVTYQRQVAQAISVDLTNAGLEWEHRNLDVGTKLFNKLASALDSYITQIDIEHTNALEAKAAADRAAANRKRNDSAEQELEATKKQKAELQAQLVEANADNRHLREKIIDQNYSRQDLTAETSTKKSPTDQLLEIAAMKAAKKLASDPVEKTSSVPVSPTLPDTVTKPVVKSTNKLLGGLVAGLTALMLVGFGGFAWTTSNNNQHLANDISTLKLSAKRNKDDAASYKAKLESESSARSEAESKSESLQEKAESKAEASNESAISSDSAQTASEQKTTPNASTVTNDSSTTVANSATVR